MIDVPLSDLVLRLVSATLCGGLIGIERDLRNIPTGFRTLGIVCLGSCVAVIAALQAGDTDSFSRVAQGIVTGIGFLGAGVIVQNHRLAEVKGLTTAAAIWLTAAIGMLCGLGELRLAFIVTALALSLLVLDVALQRWREPEPKRPDRVKHANDDAPGDG